MRKKLALILATMVFVSTFSGCGKNLEENGKSSEESTQEVTSSSEESKTEIEERENVTMELLCFGQPAFEDNFNNYQKNSPVYEEFVKQTGVELEVYGLDNDQTNIRITSGQLGDLVMINNQQQLTAMIESGLLLPLNELIEEYAPEIITTMPKRWDAAVNYGKDGNAYILPVRAGDSGTTATNGRYLYTVRWDLYKELGYPEMKTPEDLIEVLSDMIELQPTTPEGKPVYGASFYLTDTSYFGMVGTFQGTYGMTNVKGHYITRDVRTNELIYDMIDERSPYWMAVDYYNKAYHAGILDPDCFTQQVADFDAKIKSGELICSIYYNTTWEKTQDPEAGVGFANIPVEGCLYYQNGSSPAGWGLSYALGIPTTCENPERVIELIKYTFSEAGSRMLCSGVEGVHYDVVDGVPTYNEETFKLIAESSGSDEYKATGIGMTPLLYLGGYTNGTLLSDGFHADLTRDQDYMSRVQYSAVLQDFCEYYDVSWPNEIFVQMKEEGKMYDLATSNSLLTLSKESEDISRIDAACMKIAIDAVPKLVTAADEAEFERVKAETLKALEAAGAKEAEAFYKEQWDSQR